MIDHRLSSPVHWVEKRRLSNTAEYFVSPGNRTGGGHVVLFLARAMATALVWQQSQSVVGSGSSVWQGVGGKNRLAQKRKQATADCT